MITFDMFDDWFRMPKKPDNAKLVEKLEQEDPENGVKMITEIWEANGIKFAHTTYKYTAPKLQGEALIKQLQAELDAAVETQQFELAAELRDQIKQLKDG